MAGQIQKPIQVKMKLLDDVFHRVIIALERLETFLEYERNGDDAAKLSVTGMHSSRDLHDDQKNPPTLESMLREVQLDCSALFFQTEFDDEKLFVQTMKYFMNDLLEWYGGRCKDVAGKVIPYDKVESCVLPILVSLSRQVDSVTEIMQVFDEYVSKLSRIENLPPKARAEAVKKGFESFLIGRHLEGEQLQEFAASGEEVEFTMHRRGSVLEGYRRLMDAMLKLYDTMTPAKKVRDMLNAYVEGLPEFSDEDLEKLIASKEQVQIPQDSQQESNGHQDGNVVGVAAVEDSQTDHEEGKAEETQSPPQGTDGLQEDNVAGAAAVENSTNNHEEGKV